MFYIISAPSGTGKSKLIKKLIKTKLFCKAHISISYTTRPIRPGEKHGQHYYFISITEFERMITEELFIEYAKVFNNYYGTLKQTIEQSLISKTEVLFNIDWQGAKQIKKNLPEVISIFIFPPSIKELNRRLNQRDQDNKKVIIQRMKKAVSEMMHYTEYDYLIINNDFKNALNDLKNIIKAERLKVKYQQLNNIEIINNLLKK